LSLFFFSVWVSKYSFIDGKIYVRFWLSRNLEAWRDTSSKYCVFIRAAHVRIFGIDKQHESARVKGTRVACVNIYLSHTYRSRRQDWPIILLSSNRCAILRGDVVLIETEGEDRRIREKTRKRRWPRTTS